MQAHVARLREEVAGRRGSDEDGQPRDLVQERARLAAVQADSAELELAARRSELVDGAQVKAGFVGLVTTAKTRLLGVPSKAKARVPHLSVRNIEQLEDLISEALEGLANGESRMIGQDTDTRRAARCRLGDARHALAHAALHDAEPEAFERAGREVIEATAAMLAAHPHVHAAWLLQVSRWTRYAAAPWWAKWLAGCWRPPAAWPRCRTNTREKTMTETGEGERKRLAEAQYVAEHLTLVLNRAGRAMDALLNGTGTSAWRSTGPGAPSVLEEAASWPATALENTASRPLELHATAAGPGPRRFAKAARAYADALRVAAEGRWPDNLDENTAELHEAIAEAQADARLIAKGVIRGHQLDGQALRDAGVGTLARRIEHETRHELAELREIAQPQGGLF